MTPLFIPESYIPKTIFKEYEKKYFLVCEGENTEVCYFNALIQNKKELRISHDIGIIICEKTSKDKHSANPKNLLSLAKTKMNELENSNNIAVYDKIIDKFVLVFDIDIYKTNEEYIKFIEEASKYCLLAITNSCFETWLLLHKENAYNVHIKPFASDILENKKTGKSTSNTFTSKHFSRKFGFNPKKNRNEPYISLLYDLEYALIEENFINNDIDKAFGKLSSNIGIFIKTLQKTSS